jgi:hypothetical protein
VRIEVEEFPEGFQATIIADNGEKTWRTTASGRDQLYEKKDDVLHAIDLLKRAVTEGAEIVFISDNLKSYTHET